MKNMIYKKFIDDSPIACAHHRMIYDESGCPVDFEFLYANREYEDILSIGSHGIIGKNAMAVIPDYLSDGKWLNVCAEVARGGGSREIREYVKDLDRWYNILIHSSEKDRFSTYCIDITPEMVMQKNDDTTISNKMVMVHEFMDRAPYGLLIYTDLGNLVDTNLAVTDIFGYTKDELLTMNILDLIPAGDKAEAIMVFDQVKRNGYAETEVKGIRKNGELVFCKFYSAQISESDYIVFFSDITQRKKIERDLIDNNERMSLYFEIAGAIMLVVDDSGCVEMINQKGCQVLQRKKEEIIGKDWVRHFIPKNSRPYVRKVFTKILAGNIDSYEFAENQILTAQGDERVISWHNTLIRNDSGKIVKIVSSGEDITERRQILQSLLEKEKRQQITEEIGHIGSFTYDLSADQGVMSEEAYRILGYKPNAFELTYETWMACIHPDDRNMAEDVIRQALEDTEIHSNECRINRPDGAMRWIEVKGYTHKDNNGIVYIHGLVIDITDKKVSDLALLRNLQRNESLVKLIQRRTESIAELLDLTLNEAVKLTDSEIGYIYFYDEKQKEFTLNSWTKQTKSQCAVMEKQKTYQLENTGLWGEVVRQRKPIMINDYGAPNPLKRGCPEGHVPLQRFLSVPILDKENIVAVVGVGNKQSDYDQNDIWQLTLLLSNVWDVVERRRARNALKEERERARITLMSIGDAVISTDENGKIIMLNHIAEKITGWSIGQAINRPLDDVFVVENEETGKSVESPIGKVLKTGQIKELSNHIVLVSRDGRKIPISDSAAPIIDDEGNIKGGVLVFRDVTEERNKKKEIEYLSYHDKLTRIYNRRYFEDALRKSEEKGVLPLTIVMGDINGLKLVNDAFGHEMGDRILIKSAGILERLCRQGDIVARFGGDEFIMLLEGKDETYAANLCEKIKAAFSQTLVGAISLSISLGYSTRTLPEEDLESVRRSAEDMMYRRKLYESPSMRGKTIGTIMKTLSEKIPREEQHSIRVGRICAEIGRKMGYTESEVNKLATAGMLHDIGKIAISDRILEKTGALSGAERSEVQRHPEIGYRILSLTSEMVELADYVLAHHERLDGSGYPKGLQGQSIPMFSRIIAVADVYDAMTSDRPYRRALSKETAIRYIMSNADILFDAQVVDLFVKHVADAL